MLFKRPKKDSFRPEKPSVVSSVQISNSSNRSITPKGQSLSQNKPKSPTSIKSVHKTPPRKKDETSNSSLENENEINSLNGGVDSMNTPKNFSSKIKEKKNAKTSFSEFKLTDLPQKNMSDLLLEIKNKQHNKVPFSRRSSFSSKIDGFSSPLSNSPKLLSSNLSLKKKNNKNDSLAGFKPNLQILE